MTDAAQTITEVPTPTEVRADTLLALLRARFIDPGSRNGAMRLLGLTFQDMEAASRRAAWTTQFPDSPRPLPAPEFTPAKPKKAPTRVRPMRAEKGGAKLRCSLCKKWKPLNDFAIRTDRPGTGTRRSECGDCHRKSSRQRYLNVKAGAALRTVGLEFVVEEGDAAAVLVCVRCGEAIKPGEEATVSGEVGHVVCPGGEG